MKSHQHPHPGSEQFARNEPHFKGSIRPWRIRKSFRRPITPLRSVELLRGAFGQECWWLAIALSGTAFLLQVSVVDRAMMIASVFLVLVVDLLSNAIRTLAQAGGPDWTARAERTNDIGGAALLLAMLNLLVVWTAALVDRAA